MDINISFENFDVSNDKLIETRSMTGKVLDGLWSGGPEFSWVQAPFNVKGQEFDFILNVADVLKQEAELFVVIGTDEATLAAKAAIEALPNVQDGIDVRFAGQNFCTAQLDRLMMEMSRRGTVLCVVSRDGQEPEVQAAFALLKELLNKKYEGQNVERRILVVTEPGSPLAETAAQNGYVTFDYPAGQNMLYGTLSPAAIFPMAVAGIDVREFIGGAKLMATSPKWDADGTDYAVIRALNEECGIERISTFDSRMQALCKWMEALYRAKQAGKAVAVCQGFYNEAAGSGVLETVLSVDSCGFALEIPGEGKALEELNRAAYDAEMNRLAEAGGKLIKISIPKMDAFEMGQLMYFLQTSCDIAAAL